MKAEDLLIVGGLALVGYSLLKEPTPPKPEVRTEIRTVYRDRTSGDTGTGGLIGDETAINKDIVLSGIMDVDAWAVAVNTGGILETREALFAGDNLTSGILSDIGATQYLQEQRYYGLEEAGGFAYVQEGDPLLAATIEESPWAFGA